MIHLFYIGQYFSFDFLKNDMVNRISIFETFIILLLSIVQFNVVNGFKTKYSYILLKITI